jgi:hypothetical protein
MPIPSLGDRTMTIPEGDLTITWYVPLPLIDKRRWPPLNPLGPHAAAFVGS